MASGSVLLGLFCLIMIQNTNAFQFIVGGAKGWTVPSNSSGFNYNSWAESNRFSVGDSIRKFLLTLPTVCHTTFVQFLRVMLSWMEAVFVYDPAYNSVLEVTKSEYEHCNKTSPTGTYSDGHTVYSFNHSGPHYFISGYKDSCLNNEKVVIVVLADRSYNRTTEAAGSPPSPAPATEQSPPEFTPNQSPYGNGALSSMGMPAGFIASLLGPAFLASFTL
ncbi:Early nodulin-like protein 3 [Linum grandiflorum]